MTTDRELLEAAAKAEGYTVKGEAVNYSDQFTHLIVNSGHGTRKFRWNPLTDDGDALRLAVRLRLLIFIGKRAATFVVDDYTVSERHGSDPYAATRRAIVRAAAQIGGAHE
jgi:hypothetical protein